MQVFSVSPLPFHEFDLFLPDLWAHIVRPVTQLSLHRCRLRVFPQAGTGFATYYDVELHSDDGQLQITYLGDRVEIVDANGQQLPKSTSFNVMKSLTFSVENGKVRVTVDQKHEK